MVLLEVISSFLLTASQVMNIPEEYQFPAIALVAILTFIVLLGAGLKIQQSDNNNKASSSNKKKISSETEAPSTPPKKGQLGTVSTPAGRRSARLASRRKEE